MYICLLYTSIEEKNGKIENSINLLGVTPLDFGIKNNVSDLKYIFENNGIKINSCWSMGTSLDEIKNTTKAEMNVVVSVSGLEVARYLKKKFDMPYCIGTVSYTHLDVYKRQVRGDSNLCFVIGGSLGLSDKVLKRGNYSLCFSKMTFPHQLFRVMLLEQIYRGFRISNGEPYHK